MKTLIITVAVALAAFLGLIAWDVWLVLKRGVEATISYQVHQWALVAPEVPAILGIVGGFLAAHFFAPQCAASNKVPILAFLLCFHAGIVLGWLFWVQR